MSYISTQERALLEQEDLAVAANLEELSHINCPVCDKKIVRAFASKNKKVPVFDGNVMDYMKQMRNTIISQAQRNTKNINFIPGPKYDLSFCGTHASKPYSDRLDKTTGTNYCEWSAFIGFSPIQLMSRMFLRYRPYRIACIVNRVKPQEVRDWMASIDIKTLGSLFGFSFQIKQLEGTDLWVALHDTRILSASTINYDTRKVLGDEWAAELDPIVSDPPPLRREGWYKMSRICSGIEYHLSVNNAQLAIDLPSHMTMKDLPTYIYDHLIDVELDTGIKCKVKVSTNGTMTEYINTITKNLHVAGMPRKFWVVQSSAIAGITRYQDGDLIL